MAFALYQRRAPLPRETAERFERLAGARVIEGYGLQRILAGDACQSALTPAPWLDWLPMPDTAAASSTLIRASENRRRATRRTSDQRATDHERLLRQSRRERRARWTDEQGRKWLRTGDVVRMDEDGFFQILDRKKDMVIRSGLKVYPAKVEKILMTHERVADVAVIGRPDPVHTEEVVAFIVAKTTEMDQEMFTDDFERCAASIWRPTKSRQRFDSSIDSALGRASS